MQVDARSDGTAGTASAAPGAEPRRWRRPLGALALATLAATAAADPVLTVQLGVQNGVVRVDRSATTLDLGEHAAAVLDACPGLTPEVMKKELADHVDKLLPTQAPVLEILAAPAEEGRPPGPPAGDGPEAAESSRSAEARRAAALGALRRLAETDPGTASLYALSKPWGEAVLLYSQWFAAHERRQPPVFTANRSLVDVFRALATDQRLADGPLLPAADLDPDDLDTKIAGRLKFKVSPPLVAAATRLRPDANPDEWARHRGEISQAVLAPFACRLWHRERIVREVQDYLELRGVTTQPFRTARDLKDALPLRIAEQTEPTDVAGVAPERPDFGRARFGGRVLLSPDPVLDAVLIDVAPATQWPAVQRALYLLLPTQDWERFGTAPDRFLCTVPADWKPVGEDGKQFSVLRLSLKEGPGTDLALGRTYFTRRTFSERLQRLDSVGLTARMIPSARSERRKATNLLIEPKAETAEHVPKGAGPELRACDGSSAAESPSTARLPDDRVQDVVEPKRDTPRVRRNTIGGGVEYQAGKPVRPFLSYAREGLAGDDTWSVEIAEQHKASGQFAYSRDFLFFDTLQRRVQVSASAFSLFTPERPAPAGGAVDERREGVQARATIDLWRDGSRGTYGQLELGLNRSEVVLQSGDEKSERLTVLDASAFIGGAAQATPRSQRWETAATLAVGRSTTASDTFAKLHLQAAYNQFVRSFDRWDVRARVAAVTHDTPRSEWPTFGGEDSVRGYRIEAAAARRTWALQNEFWTPLSFLARGNEELARTLRRSAALALFADVGGLSSGTAPNGTRVGVGAGLRMTLNDAFVLRLDWARPVGSTDGLGEHKSRVYLTFTTFRSL